MHPLLLKIGPIPIHSYGFLIAIGFLINLWVIRRLSVKAGIDPEPIVDLAFWVLVSGFVGARILFILTRWDYYMSDPLSIFKIWEGGFVFYGGVVLAFFVVIAFVRRHRIPVWLAGDIAVTGLTIAHAFGRLGCLMAGCCYGRPTDGGWGIRFQSALVEAHLRGVPLHPTQLYESVALFILFGGLLWIFNRRSFDGQVTLTYFITYPIIRSIVETFRGDLIRGFVIDDILSTSQFISILVFLIALGFLIYRLKTVHAKRAA